MKKYRVIYLLIVSLLMLNLIFVHLDYINANELTNKYPYLFDQDSFYLKYSYRAYYFSLNNTIYNQSDYIQNINDEIENGSLWYEPSHIYFSFSRDTNKIWQVSIELKFINFLFENTVYFNEENYKWSISEDFAQYFYIPLILNPNVKEIKDYNYQSYIVSNTAEIFHIDGTKEVSNSEFQNLPSSAIYPEITANMYAVRKDDCKIGKSSHYDIGDYFEMVNNFMISGMFFTETTKYVFPLIFPNINECIFSLFSIYFAETDLTLVHEPINQGINWVEIIPTIIIIGALSLPAILTYMYLKHKKKFKSIKKKGNEY